MPPSSQDEVVAFLSRPETYGGTGPVERIDTHISTVFLAGDRVYKLKKAVRFPYLDFSTLDLRRRFCEAEIRINRRTAPELYLGVAAVARRPDGALALGRPDEAAEGEALDWLVVMRRFDQEMLFDRLAAHGRLTAGLVRELADVIARFHERAEAVPGFGGAQEMARIIDANRRDQANAGLDPARIAALHESCRAALDRCASLLDARSAQGRVRHCHGDLHLRNICLFEGRPTLFDAIEFDDAIATVDVLYDLAFLLMDLDHRSRRDAANAVLNRYLAWRDEIDGLKALPLFLACRAGIRAHTNKDASYLDLAAAFLQPAAPLLVAIGGLSGTGKSSLAAALAPSLGAAPGAVVVRSDVIRKRLLGREPEARLGPEGYTDEVSDRVYGAIRDGARRALRAGHAAIADAVHARPNERAAIAEVARAAGVDFAGIWLDTDPEALASRIGGRENDASDATIEVVRQQLGYDLGRIEWHRIDASGELAETVAAARKLLNGRAKVTM